MIHNRLLHSKRIAFLLVAGVLALSLCLPCTSHAAKRKNAKKIPVITYHRLVSDTEKKTPGIKNSSVYITTSSFSRQMKWLHKHKYRTISTQEFYDWYTGRKKLPKKSVMITFDDGDYSVIKYALPILKKYNMKACIFMIGNRIGRFTDTASQNGHYEFIGLDIMALTRLTYPKMEFQSHTYDLHYKTDGTAAVYLTSYEAQKEDFVAMHDYFGCSVLAYPYGAYTSESIPAARDSHMKMAFTYGKNGFAKKSQNRYAIKRIKIHANQSMKKFCRWF